jgi:hypothetical protein
LVHFSFNTLLQLIYRILFIKLFFVNSINNLLISFYYSETQRHRGEVLTGHS